MRKLRGALSKKKPRSTIQLRVTYSYANRNTDVVEKFSCRVDVTEEFPFLVTKLSPYYDR